MGKIVVYLPAGLERQLRLEGEDPGLWTRRVVADALAARWPDGPKPQEPWQPQLEPDS